MGRYKSYLTDVQMRGGVEATFEQCPKERRYFSDREQNLSATDREQRVSDCIHYLMQASGRKLLNPALKIKVDF